MADKNYPSSVPDSSRPILQANQDVSKGDPGDPGIHIVAQAPFIGVPADYDGSNTVMTNSFSRLYVIAGNTILADETAANGWTLTIDSVNSCGAVTYGTFSVALSGIYADTGYFVVKASKSGFPNLYARIFVKKVNKGEQGPTGPTGLKGDTGATGPQGPAGIDGTGLVVVKKSISVKSSVAVSAVNNGAGFVRVTGHTAHGFIVGQTVELDGTTYNAIGIVTAVVSTSSYDLNIAYTADESSASLVVWDLWNLRNINNDTEQSLHFADIFPVGSKPIEVGIYQTVDSFNDVWVSMGWGLYPDQYYNDLFSSEPITQIYMGRLEQLYDRGYKLLKTANDSKRSIYLRFAAKPLNWSTDLVGKEYELYLSYIKYTDTFG